MPSASVTTAVEFAVRSIAVQYDALGRMRGTDAVLNTVAGAEAFFQLSPEGQRRVLDYISLLAAKEAQDRAAVRRSGLTNPAPAGLQSGTQSVA
jgi:hypothetical protein